MNWILWIKWNIPIEIGINQFVFYFLFYFDAIGEVVTEIQPGNDTKRMIIIVQMNLNWFFYFFLPDEYLISNLLPIHINYFVGNRILHVIANCSNGKWQVVYGPTIRQQKIQIELTDTFEEIHNKLQAGEGMQKETQQNGFFGKDFRKVFLSNSVSVSK